MFKKFLTYFTKTEWALWLCGVAAVTAGFAFGQERSILSYLSSLAGITCIIINAKGNVIGQAVSIVFAVLYAAYAYTQRYYGEMLIYLLLMLPIHIISIVTWLKNKYKGRAHEVRINTIRPAEYALTFIGAACVTVVFYFILRALGTDNLIISTISLTTSVTAAYLMLRRCEYFSVCFVFNDVVLITLWSLKLTTTGISVLPSVIAFVMFLLNDAYCFISWHRIRRRQREETRNENAADQ